LFIGYSPSSSSSIYPAMISRPQAREASPWAPYKLIGKYSVQAICLQAASVQKGAHPLIGPMGWMLRCGLIKRGSKPVNWGLGSNGTVSGTKPSNFVDKVERSPSLAGFIRRQPKEFPQNHTLFTLAKV
jgi:hypothetical protein